jgi:hypothetical protein
MIELVVDNNSVVVLNDDGTIDVKDKSFLGDVVSNDKELPNFVNIEG